MKLRQLIPQSSIKIWLVTFTKATLKLSFVILVLGVIFLTLAFLRHRQLCSYQQLTDARIIETSSEQLCPNFLDQHDWKNIVSNTFNIHLTNQLSKNPSYSAPTLASAEKEKCTDELNPLCWLQGTKPKLKQTDGFTNLFIAGRDSNNTDRKYLKNTDSMMLISLDHSSGNIIYTSFPRDLYVYYTRPNGVRASYKLSAVYAIDGVRGLNGVIEQITGKPVHYHAYINLDLFRKAIDRLGGVEITLSEPFADRYPCLEVPDDRICPNVAYMGVAYVLFEFPQGKQKFDSFEALVYARSRKLSSDFDRAARQQELASALLDQVLENDLPFAEKVDLYLDLYKIFQDEVETNIGIKDASAVLAIIDKLNNNSAKIVVDPNLGGSGNILRFIGILPGVGYSVGFNDRSHGEFQRYVADVWKYLPYYNERPKIKVLTTKGNTIPANSALHDYIEGKIKYQKTITAKTDEKFAGIRLYDFSRGQKTGSLRDIQSKLPGALIYNAELDGVARSSDKEDILIIYGEQN